MDGLRHHKAAHGFMRLSDVSALAEVIGAFIIVSRVDISDARDDHSAAWPHQRDHEVLPSEPTSAQVIQHEPDHGLPGLSRTRAARWFLMGSARKLAAISDRSGIPEDS